MDSQKFCLKWDGFQGSVTSLFDSLRISEELVDVTLCCDGQRVRAHRMMLSACSPYFRDVFKEISSQQMVIFLKDTSAADLRAIIEFIYKGSVNVAQSQLASFIKTAESLQIRGLSGDEEKTPSAGAASPRRTGRPPSQEPPPPPPPPPAKRRRVSTHPAAATEAPQVIDCTSSPDPELPAAALSPAGSGGALSQHSLAASPLPAPSRAVSDHLRPFRQVSGVQGETRTAPSPVNTIASQPAGYEPSGPLVEGEECIVKVEKTEMLSGDEDSASLDAALDHVAEYEGAGVYSETSVGAESYTGVDLEGIGAAQIQPAHNVPVAAGPSQRGAGDDGSQQGFFACGECGKKFSNRASLVEHGKVHSGATQCPLCGRVASKVSDLRRHLRGVHGLSEPQVRELVPTRLTATQLMACGGRKFV